MYAVSDQDLDRKTDEKTSSVHFLRFELTATMVADVKNNVSITCGCEHENYDFSTVLDQVVDLALRQDLD